MATLALLGYGRMGKIIEVTAVRRGHVIAARVDADTEVGDVAWGGIDAAIDFSAPGAADALCRSALAHGVPTVSGTTGWDPADLIEYCRKRDSAAFLHATNMSVGVNAVFAANRLLARILGQTGSYTAEIEETHHVHKVDAPSGTAITLAEGTLGGVKLPGGWTLREEGQAVDRARQLPVRSIRRGEVSGDHEVCYASPVDTIRLSHSASSREGFALGAVLAAEYVVGRTGVVTMAEVLGIDA